jgi:hypothetical protein
MFDLNSVFRHLGVAGVIPSPAFDEIAARYPNRIPFEDALRQRTPAEEWTALEELRRSKRSFDDQEACRKLASELAEKFKERYLVTGDSIGMALVPPVGPRSVFQVVTMTAWSLVKFDPHDWSASGADMRLLHIHIVLPRSRAAVSKPASVPSPEFTHNETYSQVTIRGTSFELSAVPAAIVRLLHEAARSNCPVMEVKDLMAKAGSAGTDISDHFKRYPAWKELIGMESKGRYRLNLVSHET